jgi:hypothetical protein
MARPPLMKLRGIWRDQVFQDHKLKSSPRVVGYALGGLMTMQKTARIYKKSGKVKVWPSQKYLAKQTGLSPDTIRIAVARLIKRGHMELLKRGNQVDGANKYRIILKSKTE